MFPGAKVVDQASDDYPITVSVVDMETNTTIWTDSQKKLFRKNAGARTNSIAEIKAAVRDHFSIDASEEAGDDEDDE